MYFCELRTSDRGRMYKRVIRDRHGIDGFCTIGVAVFGMDRVLGSIP